MILAGILGAANAVNERARLARVAEVEGQQAEDEAQRLKKFADDGVAAAIASGLTRDNGWSVFPDYKTGQAVPTFINQTKGTKKDEKANPNPSLAFYEALDIDEKTHSFIPVHPGLQASSFKTGVLEDGKTPVDHNSHYIIVPKTDATSGERAMTNVTNWEQAITLNNKHSKAFDLAFTLYDNGITEDPLNQILLEGANRVGQWQVVQADTNAAAAGKTVRLQSPFGNAGPLRFMLENERFLKHDNRAPIILDKFVQFVDEKSTNGLIASLNEQGYNIKGGTPVLYNVNENEFSIVDLEGFDFRGSKWVVRDRDRRGSLRWSDEFKQVISKWSQESGKSEAEWFAILAAAENEETGSTSYQMFSDLIALQDELKRISKPIDYTGGSPRVQIGTVGAVKDRFRTLLNKVGNKEDQAAIIAALLPEDIYQGVKTKVFANAPSALEFLRPGSDLAQLRTRNETAYMMAQNARSIRDESRLVGTGLKGTFDQQAVGVVGQIRQFLGDFFGDEDALEGSMARTLGDLYKELQSDAADADTEAKLEAVILKARKFHVIQLMYTFARSMGGPSGNSDRLSDQDARYALEALSIGGLLDTPEGINLVMNMIVEKSEREIAITKGLVEPKNERTTIGAVFLEDIYGGQPTNALNFALDLTRMAQAQKVPGAQGVNRGQVGAGSGVREFD